MNPSLSRAQLPFVLTPSGRRLELSPGRSLTLGRGSSCDLTLEDSACSRQHARLSAGPGEGGECFLEDLGSTNGTFLNGRKIATKTPLSEGDRIRCGSTFLLFRVRELDFSLNFGEGDPRGDETVALSPGAVALPSEILTGSLDAIALVELLQVLLQAHLDGRLRLEFPDGEAYLELRDGEIRAACYRSARGLPALFAMALRGRAGKFSLEKSEAIPEESKMRLDLQQAMFQLCRVLDEYECDDEELD